MEQADPDVGEALFLLREKLASLQSQLDGFRWETDDMRGQLEQCLQAAALETRQAVVDLYKRIGDLSMKVQMLGKELSMALERLYRLEALPQHRELAYDNGEAAAAKRYRDQDGGKE